MYEGKPILRKIKYTNLNNPSLNSQGMKDIFLESKAPILIRDELRYNPGFKDSLEQTVEQEEYKRRVMSVTPKEPVVQTLPSQYSSLTRNNRREVAGKVGEKVGENQVPSFNYRGYQNIKSKQNHGFDIIKNF